MKKNVLSLVYLYRGEVYKPDIYQTRNCYPVQSKDTLEELDKKLDSLIKCKSFVIITLILYYG